MLLAISVAGSALVAGFMAMPRDLPEADVSELFDPAFIARSLCGGVPAPGMFIPPAAAAETPAATKLWSGLGAHSFKVTTAVPEAQAYFDQGLRLVYGFNFGEALASFRRAQSLDPTCAMCFWGEAFALGPTLNANMPDANAAPALAAATKAHDLAPAASPRERALIAALTERYSADPAKTRDGLNAAYADAMFRVYQLFEGDVDVATLHADAALNDSRTTGWWTSNGRLPTPRAASAMVALERALKIDPDHAGAIHYYIHAMDSGTRPERAEPYANKLAALMPGAGHIVHMPAHIYYRRGRYIDALNANIDALKVDDAYLGETNNADQVYRHQLYAHNIHFAFAAAGMAGDETNALALARRLEDLLARGAIQRPDYYAGAALSARTRFARPDDVLALPAPDVDAVYVRGIWHYVRVSAHLARNDVESARKDLDALNAIPKSADLEKILASYARTPQMLLIAEQVARGRIAAHEKKWEDAVTHFTAAAGVQDQQRSFDPPSWDFPVRQSLGAVLLKAGRTDEAIAVLREALLDAPNNGYVLYALMEASKTAKDPTAAAAYEALFKEAWVGKTPPDLDRL